MQVSSASSEREFSTAGQVVSKRRALLDPHTAKVLSFLKANDDLLLKVIGAKY